MLSILLHLAAAAVFALLFLVSGARLRRSLRFAATPGEAYAVDLSIGAALTGTWILFFGLLHLLKPSSLIVGFLLQTILIFLVPAGGRIFRRRWNPLLLTAGIASLPNAVIAFGPPHFYDAMVYHLGLPWQALQEGAILPHPEDLFAAFPPLTQLINLPLAAIHAWRAPAVLHLLAWIFAATAAGSLARRLGAGKIAAHSVVAATMLLPQTPLVPGFPAATGWFLAALIPAISMILGATESTRTRLNARLSPAFLLLGIACAHRLQGLSWALLLLFFALYRSRRIQNLFRAGIWGLLGSATWWLKNALLLNDPTAPVFWSRPGMEILWRDGAAWLKAGLSIHEMLTRLPVVLAPMAPAFFPLLLTGALAAAFHRRSRGLCVLATLSFLLWAPMGALPRFFAPVAILWLVIASTLRYPDLGRIAGMLSIFLSLGLGLAIQLNWIKNIDAFSLLRMDFRSAAFSVAPSPPFEAYAHLDRVLPQRSRVLLVAESRGFGFPRPFISPSQCDPSPLRKLIESEMAPEEILHQLQIEGFTHLLMNMGEFQRLKDSYPVAPWVTPAGEGKWWAFIQALGAPLQVDGPIRTWQLRAPEPPSAFETATRDEPSQKRNPPPD